jgi:VWFA-related protein
MRAVLLIMAVSVCTVAQQQPETPTFSVGVNVVNILANVMDKHGAIIRDLEQPDFTILEDGRPQTIRYFARQTDLPLTLGLLVDTSMSQDRVLDQERGASFRFLDQVLRENKDQIFVMQFDSALLTRQELTSSYRDLNDALSEVNTPTRRELENGGGLGTKLFDCVIQASNETMAKQHGRKALILLTDGDDNDSDAKLSDAIDAAQKADTLIFSILFSDSGRIHGEGKYNLEHMSRETGGGYFEVSKSQTIDQIFGIIQDELRSQYSMGYVSDQQPRIGEFRKIQVKVARAGLVVQARNRYWAQP